MRVFAFILAVSMVLGILCGCGAADGKESDTTPAVTEKKNESLNPTGESYEDGVVLEMYLYTLCSYLYTDYDAKSGAPEADLFHATAQFLITQRSDTGDDGAFSVTGAELERTMKLLFGDSVTLEAYKGYASDALGDGYDSETDTYSFVYNSETWTKGDFIPSFDKPAEQEESLEGVTAKLYVTDADGKETCITYAFRKTVEDGYLYVTLESVKVG